jgi:hypothetical protein
MITQSNAYSTLMMLHCSCKNQREEETCFLFFRMTDHEERKLELVEERIKTLVCISLNLKQGTEQKINE